MALNFNLKLFFAIMWLQKRLENRALKLISKLLKYIHRWKIRQNDVEGLLYEVPLPQGVLCCILLEMNSFHCIS